MNVIKKIILLLFTLILLSVNVVAAPPGAINITSCGTIITSPGDYALNGSLNGTEDCIIIDSDNVALYGENFTISGDGDVSDSGVHVNATDNISLMDLKIETYGVGINGFTSGNPIHSNISYDNIEVFDGDIGFALYGISNNTLNDIVVRNLTSFGISSQRSRQGNYMSNLHISDTASYGLYLSVFTTTLGVTVENVETYNNAAEGVWARNIFGSFGDVFFKNITSYNNTDGFKYDEGPIYIEDLYVFNNSGLQINDDTSGAGEMVLSYSTANNHIISTNSVTAGDRDMNFNLSSTPYGSGPQLVSLNESAIYFDYFNQTSDINFSVSTVGGYIILDRNGVLCIPTSTPACGKLSNSETNAIFNVTSWSNYSYMNITRDITSTIVNNSFLASNAQDLEGTIDVDYQYLQIVNITTDLQSIFVDENATSPFSQIIDVDLTSYPDGQHWLNIDVAGNTGYFDDIVSLNYTFDTYNLGVGTCGGAYNFTILNISYFDEVTDAQINVDNGMSLTLNNGVETQVVSELFLNETNSTICTNLDPSNSTFNWNAYGTFTLEKSDYVTRVYSISEEDPLVLSNGPTTNLSLFMIPINDSTTVSYTWQTTNFGAIDGTMKVYRCNLDGTEDLIESAPIISSSSNANIQLFSQTYRYEVVIGGVIYTDPAGWSSCHVESESTLSFFVDIDDIDIDDLIGLASVECDLIKSGTNQVTLNWGPNPELSSPDVQGCIRAYRTTVSGLTEIYDNCATSATYTRSVTIPANGNEYTVDAYLKQGNNIIQCNEQLGFSAAETDAGFFGFSALIAVFFLLAAMTLIFGGDGEIQLVGLGVGLIGVWFLGILPVAFNVIASIIGILVIVIGIGRYTRK